MKKKATIAVAALSLVLCFAIGGTLAWLFDSTEEVKNTFTTAGIDIELVETPNTDGDDDDTTPDHWEAQMIPGKEYSKDPVVSVKSETTDVDCYLFVKFEEKNNASEYLDYTSTLKTENGWTPVDGESNVWYRIVRTSDTTKSWNLLENNKVTVRTALKKDKMPAADSTPELVYTAYAIQLEGFSDAAAAWDEISN